MESATTSVTIRDVSHRERAWAKMLALLSEDEKAALFRGSTELMLHDQFVDGEISITDVRVVISAGEWWE